MLRFPSVALAVVLLIAIAPTAEAAKAQRGVTTKVSRKTLTIAGDKKANKIVVRLKKRDKKTLEIDTGGSSRAEFNVKRSKFNKIVISPGAGNDTVTIDEKNGVFTNSEKTTAKLGAGNDTFRSGASDRNDNVDGQAGNDRLLVGGSAKADAISVARSGARARVLRGTVVAVDSAAVETLELAPLAGADELTLNDLAGTSLRRVAIDLAPKAGGTSGDGAADKLVVSGGAASDRATITGNGASVGIAGLGPSIAAVRVEPAADTLTVGGAAGADKIDAGALTGMKLTADGGPGDDEITGGAGDDALGGGDGNDSVSGGAGSDSTALGGGDDRYAWKPGDGNDSVDGGDGSDRVNAAGSGDADELTASNDATRVRIARGGESVLGDAIETAEVAPGGGADRVTVADLRGTDVAQTNVAFGDDGQADELDVNGTGGDDSLALGSDGGATLTGMGRITTTGGDGGSDKLVVRAGAGNDTIETSGLTAGKLALVIDGGDGADSITSSGGNDTVDAGPGDDTVSAVPGGSDTIEAGDGNDRLVLRGTDGADDVSAAANGTRIQLLSAGTPFADAGGFERLDFQPLGGADKVLVGNLAAAGIATANADLAAGGGGDSATDVVTVEGTDAVDNVAVSSDASGAHVAGVPVLLNVTGSEAADRIGINTLGGADTVDGSTVATGVVGLNVNGGDLADVIIGTVNADTVIGGRGDDAVFLRAGDDSFQWDPGDGNDTLEGQAGTDRVIFNGANVAETIEVSANGGRVRLFRNVGNVTIDADDIDQFDLNALGGADNVIVGDVSGTDLKATNVDLAGAPGGSDGDGQADVVTVNGTNGDDTPKAASDAAGVHVTGLTSAVNVAHAEPTDQLTMNLQGGLDVFNASELPAGVLKLVINGGLGNDIMFGSQGDDLLNGGDGDDTGFLGAGDDTFTWNPGDDNDVVEGQSGAEDRLLFNGANVGEEIDVSANGGRVRFTRNIANVTMDTDNVERIDFNALGGVDKVTVGDVSGTDLKDVNVDLAGAGGAPDAQPDTVIQNATGGDDLVVVEDSTPTTVTSQGLAARVDVLHPEPANDKLTVNLLAGEDVIEASELAAGLLTLTADGGAGDDVMTGSDGNDVLLGGADDDFLKGGPGTDTLDGGTGTNQIIQD